MKVFRVAIIIIAWGTIPASPQTIHINDVDYFVGCYAINKTESGDAVIDCSKFMEWRIIRPTDGLKRPGLNEINRSDSNHWIYRWSTLPKQENRLYSDLVIPPEIDNLRYYIFYDFFGWEKQKNVLTIWRQVGKDSLSYICGQTEEVETYIGSALIKDIALFPDSSLVMAIQLAGEDFENHIFITGPADCKFSKIYESGWNRNYPEIGESAKNFMYDYSHLNYPYFQVVEIEKCITGRQMDFFAEYAYSTIDSVNTKILNLWEIAQK